MTTLATEPWSATSTTAWPSQWVAGQAGGGASVANSRGRLTPDRAGYRIVRRLLVGLGASDAKRRTTGRLILSNIGEANVWISGREQVGTADYYPTGYFIRLRPDAQSWKIGAGYGGGEYGPSADTTTGVPITFAANDVVGFTIDVDGFTVSARLWNITAGQAEPTTWQSTWTDADQSFPTGVPALSIGSGNTNVAYVDFTPVTVTDGAASATSTASASSVGSASAVSRLTARSTASAGASGSADAVSRLGTVATATATGAGAAAAGTVLVATSTATAAAEGTAAASTVAAMTAAASAAAAGSAQADTQARVTANATAGTTGTAAADALLRTTSSASVESAGTATGETIARLQSTAVAAGEGAAHAATDAPGISTASAGGTGSADARTAITGASSATALSFGTTDASTTLAASSSAAAIGTGTAAALDLILHTITRAVATGAGAGSATSTVKTGETPHVAVITATIHRRTTRAALPPRAVAASTARAWRAAAHADHP